MTIMIERFGRAGGLGLAFGVLALSGLTLVGCDEELAESSAGAGETTGAVTKTAAAKTTDGPEDLAALYARLKPAERERAPFVQPADQTDMPPIRFDPPGLHYGVLGRHDDGEGTATFTNVSDAAIRLGKVVTSCHCTTVDLEPQIIEPGQSVSFNIVTKPKSGLGDKMIKVRMAFAGYGKAVDYPVRWTIATPLRQQPSFLPAGERNPDNTFTDIMTGEVWVEAADKQPFSIFKAGGLEPEFVDFDPARDEPRYFYKLKWDLTKYTRAGKPIPWFWVVETDRDDVPVVEYRVRHQTTLPTERPGTWMLEDQGVVFGELNPGETRDLVMRVYYMRNRPPTPRTAEIDTRSSQYGVRVLGVEDDPEDPLRRIYKFRVTARQARDASLVNDQLRFVIGVESLPFTLMGRIVEQ